MNLTQRTDLKNNCWLTILCHRSFRVQPLSLKLLKRSTKKVAFSKFKPFCGQIWPTTDIEVILLKQTVSFTLISDQNDVEWHTTRFFGIDEGYLTTSGLEVSQSDHKWSDRPDFLLFLHFTSSRVFWYIGHFSTTSRSTSSDWNPCYPPKSLFCPYHMTHVTFCHFFFF